MNRTPFLLFAWALCLTSLWVFPPHAQAFSITDYHQDRPGRADGVIIIDGLDYSTTQLAVQIATSTQPVDFDLIQKGNQVHVVIRDAHMRTTSTAMTVTVVSNHQTKPRTFQIKGQAPHDEPVTPTEESETADESDALVLQYEALPTTQSENESALEIDINGGQKVRTVRQAIELLLLGTSIKLNERIGDARALDAPLDPEHPVRRLKDIYVASKGEVGHIYLDGLLLVVAPKGTQQRIALSKPSTQPSTAENQIAHSTQSPKQTMIMTIRAIVDTLCAEHNIKLDEQLGDARLLDQQVVVNEDIHTFEQLYRIENTPIHQVVFDTRNGEHTVRLL